MTSAHLTSDLYRPVRPAFVMMSLEGVLRWVVALVLIAAVVSKCLAPGAIASVAAYLLHTSPAAPVVSAAVILLVMLESAIAAALITRTRLIVTGGAAACFFVALSVALLMLGADPAAPRCACMGSLHAGLLGESTDHAVWAGLLRNAGLIAACVMIARGTRSRGAP